MSRSELDLGGADALAFDAGSDPYRDSRVRYRVLAVACSLAVLGYLTRVGFATAAPELKAQLGLGPSDLSFLMAAFMIAYGLVEVPCGLIADRLGARNLLVVLVLGWSFVTGAIAWVTWLPTGTVWPLVYLVALRAAFGMFQGGIFPSISRMMTDWMPIDERGAAQGMIWMSSRLGGALAPRVVVQLFRRFGTGPKTFWSLAAIGAVWCAFFWPWFRNRPEEMAGVSAAERKRIGAGRPAKATAGHAATPWRAMAGSLSVWALCLTYGCLGFTGNFFITLMPEYLRTQRGLSVNVAGWLSSLPLACGVVACVLGGFLSDVLLRRMKDRRWGRRLVGASGLTLAATALLATIWARDPIVLGALLCLAFFGNDLSMGPAWAACGDIGEGHAGTLGGAMNMTASLTGASAAFLAGQLLQTGHPDALFVILSGSYALGVVCWMGVDVTKTLSAQPDE
jgi:sugar phosphate permease